MRFLVDDMGMGIGMSVLGRRHPRFAFWLALIIAALFAVYAIGLGIASAVKYGDAQRWAAALRCRCYERVAATFEGSSATGNKGELSLRFRDSSGQREVPVIGAEASSWQGLHAAPGDQLSLIEWSGKVPAIDARGGWIRTEDYPAWGAWDVGAPGIAVFVSVVMLLYARECRSLAAFRWPTVA